MAGGSFAKNQAKILLKLSENNPGIPDFARRSARLILEGRGTQGDLDLVLQHTGTRRSGASAIRGALKAIQAPIQSINDVTQSIELYQATAARGKDTSAATMRIVTAIQNAYMGVVTNKHFKTMVKQTTDYVGKTLGLTNLGVNAAAGRSFTLALARAGRLFGAVGAVAGVGVAAHQNYWSAQANKSVSRFEAMSAFATRGINGGIMLKELGKARNSAMREESWLNYFTDPWNEQREKRIAEIASNKAAYIDGIRKNYRRHGVNLDQVYAEKARTSGTSVSLLSDREKREALDNALSKSVDTAESNLISRAEAEYMEKYGIKRRSNGAGRPQNFMAGAGSGYIPSSENDPLKTAAAQEEINKIIERIRKEEVEAANSAIAIARENQEGILNSKLRKTSLAAALTASNNAFQKTWDSVTELGNPNMAWVMNEDLDRRRNIEATRNDTTIPLTRFEFDQSLKDAEHEAAAFRSRRQARFDD